MLAENINYMNKWMEKGFFKQPSGQAPEQTAHHGCYFEAQGSKCVSAPALSSVLTAVRFRQWQENANENMAGFPEPSLSYACLAGLSTVKAQVIPAPFSDEETEAKTSQYVPGLKSQIPKPIFATLCRWAVFMLSVCYFCFSHFAGTSENQITLNCI